MNIYKENQSQIASYQGMYFFWILKVLNKVVYTSSQMAFP